MGEGRARRCRGRRIARRKVPDIRGDTDEAWLRAEAFIVEELKAAISRNKARGRRATLRRLTRGRHPSSPAGRAGALKNSWRTRFGMTAVVLSPEQTRASFAEDRAPLLHWMIFTGASVFAVVLLWQWPYPPDGGFGPYLHLLGHRSALRRRLATLPLAHNRDRPRRRCRPPRRAPDRGWRG